VKQIAVLIPTYKRPSKLKELVENFFKYSKDSSLYFIINLDDNETVAELARLKNKFDFSIFNSEEEYVGCINYGVKTTKEPFIFCGADDILFTKDWDLKLLKVMQDKSINVSGGIDDWTCSKSGVHISHPLVRRSYIEGVGSYWGGNDGLYFNGYKHYQCDIELEQLAWFRNCFRLCKEVTIHHNHYINKKSVDDETYAKSRKKLKKDVETYNERCSAFEFWDLASLHQGLAMESVHKKKRLSIVMPIWNCEKWVRRTLDSLIKQTKHKFELIMLDDKSTEFDGAELLKELKEIAIAGGFVNVITKVNKKQKYTNANWNRGVELATGNYIAIINSDIDFLTEEWDDYLIENIDLGYELANPYQQDRVYSEKPYAKASLPDVNGYLNIRGACYLMSKKFAERVFPIPNDYVHWCGDNYISRQVRDFIFDIRVAIYHHISKSGEKVDQRKFWEIVEKDVENWIANSGDITAKPILENCRKRTNQWKNTKR
jgi:glycosyltransferase involved in cell wall biosynthesis